MSYSGDFLNACGLIDLDFSTAYAIVVSGDGPNVCGHMLVNCQGRGGYYFHVAELYDYPRYMNDSGYRRYLREAGKSELGRYRIPLPNPDGAALYLENLMSQKWTWMVLPNNCVAFVEEVLAAGGADFGSYSNCPAMTVVGEDIRATGRQIQRELSDDAIRNRILEFQRWATGF